MRALYEMPKLVESFGKIADAYQKMSEWDKEKLVWEGAKAIIAGTVEYNPLKSMLVVYSMFLENSKWKATVDFIAGILKKYGGDGTTTDVMKKAALDFLKSGVKNK